MPQNNGHVNLFTIGDTYVSQAVKNRPNVASKESNTDESSFVGVPITNTDHTLNG